MAPVYVSRNGRVSIANGIQPKDALLFSPSVKSPAQVIRELRETRKRNSKLIRERFDEAFH